MDGLYNESLFDSRIDLIFCRLPVAGAMRNDKQTPQAGCSKMIHMNFRLKFSTMIP
jgi:hypothetical protein